MSLKKVMTMPYSFVIYAISHGNNFTKRSNNKDILKYKNKNESVNYFMKTWDEETQYFIKELRNYLLKSSNSIVEEC